MVANSCLAKPLELESALAPPRTGAWAPATLQTPITHSATDNTLRPHLTFIAKLLHAHPRPGTSPINSTAELAPGQRNTKNRPDFARKNVRRTCRLPKNHRIAPSKAIAPISYART